MTLFSSTFQLLGLEINLITKCCLIQGNNRTEIVLKLRNRGYVDTTVKTDLSEQAVTDVMYDVLNTTKHKKSLENAKQENYSEIGKVSQYWLFRVSLKHNIYFFYLYYYKFQLPKSCSMENEQVLQKYNCKKNKMNIIQIV